jgi:hypothetical protein
MKRNITRRKFVKNSVSASLALGLTESLSAGYGSFLNLNNFVKVGIIGTGNRGIYLMS